MITPKTILVVDDEATIREVVRKYLEQEQFRVVEAATGPDALDRLEADPPDLLVLDIMLPGLDGFAIARALRKAEAVRGSDHIPLIMLTARTEESDRIVGFELGADDYVTKPFSPRELVMRIKAVLRRSAPAGETPGDSLVYGDLRLDVKARQVTRAGAPIELTAKEFDLLYYLASHPRQVFSREQLLDQVWGYGYVGDDSTVTVHIHRLREKIEADPTAPAIIVTVWGAGYKFEAPA
jgi:DNA-binding response OmpR family regulator